MKFVVRCSLLAASAVLGVVAAVFIAEHVPAAASGDATPHTLPAIHADVMLVTIQLQQPASREPEPGRSLAEAPLPP